MTTPELTADFFAGRRKALQERLDADLLVITAAGQMQRNSDMTYPFRQDSNFYYLTGLTVPDAILVCRPKQNEEWLILPSRNEYLNLFDGQVNVETLKAQSGIEVIEAEKSGWERLKMAMSASQKVATLQSPPAYVGLYSFYANPARARLLRRLRRLPGKPEVEYCNQVLADMRMVKQPEDIEVIRRAVNITTSAFKHIASRITEYEYENEVEADLLHSFITQGAREPAYGSIVAAGAHACTLHYMENAGAMVGELVLIDAGAEYQLYGADITRTYPLRDPSSLAMDVLAGLEEIQQYHLSLLKPGVSVLDCERATREKLGEVLVRLGLLTKNTPEGVRRYYTHMGHFLGLDTHDAGDYHKPLEPGVVLTIEPGIYIPEQGIGARLEDDIVITATGAEVLSADLAKR